MYSILVLVLSLWQLQASDMREDVMDAVSILTTKQTSSNPIPAKILRQAKAIGIIKITKGAFGVGGASGEGVIVVKMSSGWSAPIAFSQGGGSIGFQIGVDIKKLIYIFNTDAAWRAFVGANRVRFQAAAQATAGPDYVSEDAAEGLPECNVYVYALADGAFAGTSIGGQMVGASNDTNEDAYHVVNVVDIIKGKVSPPPYARALYDLLNLTSKGK